MIETKKISQLPLMDGLSEDTHIVVQSEGTTKRIPADKAIPSGVVKSVNSVTPDEDGNVALPAVTEEDIVDLMMEMGMLPTLIDADGKILTDNSGAILLG